MKEGLFFALLTAVCFGASSIFARRGLHRYGGPLSAVTVTMFTGTLIYSSLLFFTGELDKVWSLSWQGFVLLGIAGIIHFIGGRYLSFSCISLIGANRAGALERTSALFAVVAGVIFLNEPLTIFLVLGVLCIVGGATLVSMKTETGRGPKVRGKAVLSGLGGGLCMGISGALIKPGIEEVGSPLAAIFVSYAIVSAILASLLLHKQHRKQFIQFAQASLVPLVVTGILASSAQLFRYIGLSYSPLSLVQPLVGTSVVFTLFFSFLVNRDIEVFAWNIILGVVITVIGSLLFFL